MAAEPGTPRTFNQQIVEANRLFEAGKLSEALSAIKAASQLETNRFEAPFLAAVVFVEMGNAEAALAALDAALVRAPDAKKPDITALQAEVEKLTASAKRSSAPAPDAPQSPETRRKLDALMLIVDEADKAQTDKERKRLLSEFLEKSGVFVANQTNDSSIWLLRSVAALELNKPKEGWAAGRELKRLGGETNENPKVRKVIAALERKGWWVDSLPTPDYKKLSIDALRPLAAAGDSAAQTALGIAIKALPYDEKEWKQREAEAVEWLRKATAAGDLDAKMELGDSLLRGWQFASEVQTGVRLLKEEAAKGNRRALYRLGIFFARGACNETGHIVERPNPDAAIEAFQICAEDMTDFGAAAKFQLAEAYYNLKGQHSQAAHWYRLSLTNYMKCDPQTWPPGALEGSVMSCASRLAWILATSPDDTVRNAAEGMAVAKTAVQSAEKQVAVEGGWDLNHYYALRVLAAACAESGDFETAVKTEQAAIQLLPRLYPDPDVAKFARRGNDERIKIYKKRKPFRTKEWYY